MSKIRAVFLLAMCLAVSACGTNPVTGARELQFISEASEIQMGEQNYAPARQSQGGDYTVDRGLTRYVQGVGSKLAAVSDRALPYEFEVLNNPVPNAWAMPGGKIAINRGLLTELNSEAELAAVLGHEIVHAAARHGAQQQEVGMLMQGGMLVTAILSQGSDYGNLLAGGAAVGAQLISSKYGRDDELESDLYGMKYMVAAGYNPLAAVELQKTFVRLAEGRNSDWLSGLFASHPPSQERVEKNRQTAAELGGDKGAWGREEFKRAMAQLTRDADAYAAQEKSLAAAREKDWSTAVREVTRAIQLQPEEAQFHGLRGDIRRAQKKPGDAITNYDRAINNNPNYFAFYLNRGLAYKALGRTAQAKESLEKANTLLPTAVAHKELGDMALLSGKRDDALAHFQFASQSNTTVGEAARASVARLDLPENPGRYLQVAIRQTEAGEVVLLVANRSPLDVERVVIDTAHFDAAGRQTSQVRSFPLRGVLSAGETATVRTGGKDPQGMRAAVKAAKISER